MLRDCVTTDLCRFVVGRSQNFSPSKTLVTLVLFSLLDRLCKDISCHQNAARCMNQVVDNFCCNIPQKDKIEAHNRKCRTSISESEATRTAGETPQAMFDVFGTDDVFTCLVLTCPQLRRLYHYLLLWIQKLQRLQELQNSKRARYRRLPVTNAIMLQ